MRIFPAFLIAAVASGTMAARNVTPLQMKSPQSRPAGYTEVHAQQRLGHAAISRDGGVLLYEWGRPYLNWVPDTSWMAPAAARRLETFLYQVDLNAKVPTSVYLFYPNAGSTYWLGDLSPDETGVVLYELDHDTRRVRAGVWSLLEQKVKWFEPAADEGRLEGVTAWISNEEFLYPAKAGRTAFVRANVTTGEARLCTNCGALVAKKVEAIEELQQQRLERIKGRVAQHSAPVLLADATVVAGSDEDGVVYLRDTAEVLSLLYREGNGPVTVLFENRRQWPQPSSDVSEQKKQSR